MKTAKPKVRAVPTQDGYTYAVDFPVESRASLHLSIWDTFPTAGQALSAGADHVRRKLRPATSPRIW